MKKNTFKTFLATGKMPEEADVLDEAIAAFEQKAEDESLAEHDKKYHGGHYNPETQTCGKRDKLKKTDSVDIVKNTGKAFKSSPFSVGDKVTYGGEDYTIEEAKKEGKYFVLKTKEDINGVKGRRELMSYEVCPSHRKKRDWDKDEQIIRAHGDFKKYNGYTGLKDFVEEGRKRAAQGAIQDFETADKIRDKIHEFWYGKEKPSNDYFRGFVHAAEMATGYKFTESGHSFGPYALSYGDGPYEAAPYDFNRENDVNPKSFGPKGLQQLYENALSWGGKYAHEYNFRDTVSGIKDLANLVGIKIDEKSEIYKGTSKD